MPDKKGRYSRRDFIKTSGIVCLGSTLIPVSTNTPALGGSSSEEAEEMMVPMRVFGKLA